jgi:2-hydroxychromene-2-carboxylate isomerase
MHDPEHSVARGTIGAPTFFAGDEVFFRQGFLARDRRSNSEFP